MHKCWFVLKQTDYPPPKLPDNGIGVATGVLCPGHIVPDPMRLDDVINRKSELIFEPDMPIFTTVSQGLQFANWKRHNWGLDGNAGLPVAAAAGVTVGGVAGLGSKKSARDFWEFDSLEKSIVQPTELYIEDCAEEEEVKKYIEKHKSPLNLFGCSVYMITGVAIARGGKGSREEYRQRYLHGGPEVMSMHCKRDVANLARAGLQASEGAEEGLKITHGNTTDFVWAVRFSKISQGTFDRKWNHRTLSKGATYGVKEDQQEQKEVVQKALEEEELGDAEVIEDEEGDIFIVPR